MAPAWLNALNKGTARFTTPVMCPRPGEIIMVHVTFITPSGVVTTLDGDVGQSVMDIGKRAGVENIIGECGGSAACATCHVHVDPAWIDMVGPPSQDEWDMLDFAHGKREDSRLSCQIRLRPALDGLVVHTPERQG